MGKKRWKHHEHRHRSHPSWRDWDRGHDFSRWPAAARRVRGRLFLRFVGAFGIMALLVLGGMAILAFLLSRLFGGGGKMAAMIWFGGCGLSLALPLLAGAVALRAFRSIATPMADVMAAADAVAEGDLSVRVPEPTHGPDEFTKLANSFNRMVEELARADRQRRNLTADVAHELRTPLHIIQGNLEGLLDGVYEPTEAHIDATLDEARGLARLVDDLRILSLAEAGQLPLQRELIDVAELLTDVATSFSGQAEVAGIDLRVDVVGDPSDLTIIGDAGRLDQVLSNLMANALRHTPSGGTVSLRSEAQGQTVRISVQDTGEGIASQDLPFIFERFWRSDPSRSHAGGAGSGLGLAIARQLVQAHGGHIAVESRLGQGTLFTIDLPTDRTENDTDR